MGTHRFFTKWNLQLQSSYYASSSLLTSSVCTEPSRIGARKLLSESKLILHKAPGLLLQKVDNDLASHVASEDVSSLINGHLWSSRARGNLVPQHEEKFGNLPEDVQLT